MTPVLEGDFLPDPSVVNRRELLGYLGVRGEPDAQTKALTEDCLRELWEKLRPKHLLMEVPLRLVPPRTADLTALRLESASLYRHLRGCDRALLFAATLGDEADFLIRRYETAGISRAVVLQACAAATIEAYCDRLCAALREAYAARGDRLTPRFSPGYGDLALQEQIPLARVMRLEKTVGIRLTEALMMLPTKSVTAVIGIAPEADGRKEDDRKEDDRNQDDRKDIG